MTAELYLTIGAVVAVLALIAGAVMAAINAEGAIEVVSMSALALFFAAGAGMAWPATALVAIVAGPILWFKNRAERAYEQELWAFRQSRSESDRDKYRRMAGEQRDLARLHRSDPELVNMHEGLAKQYDGLADLFREGNER